MSRAAGDAATLVTGIDPSLIAIPTSELDNDYDTYEAFNRGLGAGGANPYDGWATKRKHGPIEVFDLAERLGRPDGKELPPGLAGVRRAYTALSYEAVMEVLRDYERFPSGWYKHSMGSVFGHSILEMDGSEHSRYRALAAQAFRQKVLERWEKNLIRPVIDELVDAMAPQGHADLVQEFTFNYPVKVIAGMMGVPLAHGDWFRRRAVDLISVAHNMDRALLTRDVLTEYFTQIITYRRSHPGDDLVTELVAAEVDGHRLADEEILPFLMLLAPAGAETTFRSTGNLLFGLLTNPDQLEAVRDDRSLIPQAIEEAIRWEPPLTFIARQAADDTSVCGVEIEGGSMMGVSLGSANRDASVWGSDADDYDIFREHQQHTSFAFGHHMCLGMHLARLEMEIALNRLFDRLPGLRLDGSSAGDVAIEGFVFRSPNRLPVKFDVA